MKPFDLEFSSGDAHLAASFVAEPRRRDVMLIAGGTDLMPLLKAGLVAPDHLVSLKQSREMRYLRFADDGTLHLGALTTLAEIERDAEVGRRLPILPQSVRDAATPQLRAMATAGGNLLQRNRCWYFRGPYDCWLKGGDRCFARDGENKYSAIFDESPCVAVHPSDLAPALVALDAQVVIAYADHDGTERAIPVAELLQPPTADHRIEHRLPAGTAIAELRVPPQPEGARGAYLKAMDRHAWAFALTSAAAQLTLRDGVVERVRLVLGAVANVPYRATAAEDLLTGQRLTPELAARAAEAAVAGAAPLAHNGYKLPQARELARRALLQAAGMLP